MVPIQNDLMDKLIQNYSLKREDLTYLAGGREDSDGITYRYTRAGKPFVLKISAREKSDGIEKMKKKLEFASYLGDNGVPIACPKPSEDGVLFYIEEDATYNYIVSVMDFVEGGNPQSSELTQYADEWGRLTGRMHRLTKQYPIWKNLTGDENVYGYEQELQFMMDLCKNEIVHNKWIEMKEQLSKLEINRDCYGLIHNDNHQYNIIAGKKGLTLLDFDCAECNFLINDLFVPIQGMLFDTTGGMLQPIYNGDLIKRFYEAFLHGYETETHISIYWLDQMELFLDYRRLLTFTVSQGWMEADPAVKKAFLEMIQNPVPLKIF